MHPGSAIRVVNARIHNLKGVTIDLPHRQLIVVTGPSGSGKSSLAFDTLYAEGQRRYIESLSTYAKQFLERMAKPPVDLLEGLAPAVAIERRLAPLPKCTISCGSSGPEWAPPGAGAVANWSAGIRPRPRRTPRWRRLPGISRWPSRYPKLPVAAMTR